MEHSLANALLAANFLLELPKENNERKLERICMINENGKIVKKFKTAELAAKKIKVNAIHIRMAITMGTNLGGYTWRWN